MDENNYGTAEVPTNVYNIQPLSTGTAKQLKTKKFILSKYTIYETKERMYIVGSNKRETMFRILEIDLTVPQEELTVLEDNIFFTRNEIMDVLLRLEEASEDGLQKKLTVYGLLGFIRFTSCYYLIAITKFSQVAVLGGHPIYHIDGTELIPITKNYKKPDKYSTEAKLMATFQSLDLTKTFYFSYTYDITNTLQTNLLREKLKAIDRNDITIPSGMDDYNEMYMWNMNLLQPLFNCIETVYDWFQCIIHGFIDQVNVSILGKAVYITLIARRSHHFAGARFLKRGVNNQGYVANEVETEQVVADMILTPFHNSGTGYFDSDRYTSFVQHRGSIPLYWTQAASNLTAKPPIQINVIDPYFQPAALHFDKLFQRYGGGSIQVLNLIKTKEKNPRETKLLKEFEECITYLNKFLLEEKKIQYKSWDMSRASKQDGQGVIEFLEKYASQTVSKTGIFHNSATFKETKIQEGICRTNCIDCLDRTNAAQFVIGKRALGVQLNQLGIIDNCYLEYDSDIVNILTELFHDLGDTIALQYGGSHLVNTMETYRKINQWSSHSRDMIESIKRFYSNSFIDAQRQDAINLFLGHYVWREGFPSLWEMNTDFYLHNEYSSQGPRKSYTHWWNNYHIESLRSVLKQEIVDMNNDVSEEQILRNIKGLPGAFDNYWNEYYIPKSFTWISELFAYNMNSTRRYQDDKKLGNNVSPFVSRKQSWLNKQLKNILLENEQSLLTDVEESHPKENTYISTFESTEITSCTPKQNLDLTISNLTDAININRKLRGKVDLLLSDKLPLIFENSDIESTLLIDDKSDSESKDSNNNIFLESSLQILLDDKNDDFDTKMIKSRGYLTDISTNSDYYLGIKSGSLLSLSDYSDYSSFEKIKLEPIDLDIYKNSIELFQNNIIFE